MEIQYALISVRHTKNRNLQTIPWPVMGLSSWVKYVMQEQGGQLLLNGYHISQVELWKISLKHFWDTYFHVDPTHPTFTHGLDRASTLPYFLHGDEGRGKNKSPLMVLSFQGLLSHYGDMHLNESGPLACCSIFLVLHIYTAECPTCCINLRHSFCSRLLYTVLPSRCYNGDTTIFQVLDNIAADCTSLFLDGLDVTFNSIIYCNFTGVSKPYI